MSAEIDGNVISDRPLLNMEAISKTFLGVRALERVDLRVAAGKIHALIGKNGAGKSTLIKILGGVHQPDSGKIYIGGRQLHLTSPLAAIEEGIAIVHQELSLVPGLSVAENIFLGRWKSKDVKWRVAWEEMRSRAGEVLDRLTANINPRSPACDLSLAQQQLVEIAKALCRAPRILVMDEPTSSLSTSDGKRLLTIAKRLADSGVGIIYISHHLAEIEQIADEITILRDGRTVGTWAAGSIDRSKIVQLMLGEELIETSVRPQTSPSERVLLSVRHLSRRGHLEDISFDLHAGEILGLAGLVGAGRTELARAIFGRDRTHSGTISVAGVEVKHPTPSRMRQAGVGLVPEDRKTQGLVPHLSVGKNLVLTILSKIARFGFLQKKQEKRIARQLITDLEIRTKNRHASVRTLSGGNQQKVVIGKWLARRSSILILDEPTRGVDVHAKAQIMKILDQLASDGIGILFISSELEEVVAISHRVLTMASGRIVAETSGHQTSMKDILLSATGA